jgi:hypothetical protein
LDGSLLWINIGACEPLVICSVFLFLGIIGGCTQGLMLAGQVLYHLSYSTSPVFCVGYFRGRISQSICLGWLPTVILLIFDSQVARITGVSHLRLASHTFWGAVPYKCFLFL